MFWLSCLFLGLFLVSIGLDPDSCAQVELDIPGGTTLVGWDWYLFRLGEAGANPPFMSFEASFFRKLGGQQRFQTWDAHGWIGNGKRGNRKEIHRSQIGIMGNM